MSHTLIQRFASFRTYLHICAASTMPNPKSNKIVYQDGKSNNDKSESLKLHEQVSNMYIKKKLKLPQKPPFAKNLFLGKFDTDMLAYPEVLENDDLKKLETATEPIYNFFNSAMPVTPAEAARMQLVGLRVNQMMGGRELSVTELCKFAEAISSRHSNVNLMHSEQLVVQMLMNSGDEKLISKYLPDLVSGKYFGGFAFAEKNNDDPRNLNTIAEYRADKNMWELNGEKCNVINGSTSNMFIVFARADKVDTPNSMDMKPTAFIVEKSFGNITANSVKQTGLTESDIANVKFENILIPSDNILGNKHEAELLLFNTLPEYRLTSAVACTSILRETLKEFIMWCKNGDKRLHSTDIVHMLLSQITCALYSSESMIYFTAALMDKYEKQDCAMEAAIIRSYTAHQAYSITTQLMKFMGSAAYENSNKINILHRDALSYLTLNENLNTLDISIALQGLQHAGIELQQHVTKMRNPLYYSTAYIKELFKQRGQSEDNPKLTLGLHEYVHPTLIGTVQWLEYCVLRLQFATDVFLSRYGIEITTKHMDLLRLTQIVSEIYAMTASISRASRAYCIGLRNADYDLNIANSISLDAMEKVKYLVNQIYTGPYNTNDTNFNKIGKAAVERSDHIVEHPLTKNY